MKKVLFSSLFTVSTLFLGINSSLANEYIKGGFTNSNSEINLSCSNDICNLNLEIYEYINGTPYLTNPNDVTFYLKDDGVIVDSMMLSDFIQTHLVKSIPKATPSINNIKLKSKVSNISRSGEDASTQDSPLNCEFDVDFDCSEWEEHYYTAQILNQLNNMDPLRITVTQESIDFVERLEQWIASLLTAVPAGRIASAIAALGRGTVERIVLESLTTAIIADQVSQALKENKLEDGDIIETDGRGYQRIIKGGGSTGGGSTGGGSTGGGWTGGGWGGGSAGSGGQRVCTGEKGYQKCYFVRLY